MLGMLKPFSYWISFTCQDGVMYFWDLSRIHKWHICHFKGVCIERWWFFCLLLEGLLK